MTKVDKDSDSGEVRRWLEDTWRHGEVVAGAEGDLLPVRRRRPLVQRLRRFVQHLSASGRRAFEGGKLFEGRKR